jgi:MFS family permease
LGCLFFGRLVDQFGPRRVLLPLLFNSGLIISLFPFIGRNLVLFYLAHFALGLSTTGAVAYSKLISTWFFHKRAIALTALGFGCFVSMVLSPFVVRTLMNVLGWRNVYFVFGAVTIFITFPVLYFFFKERKVSPEEFEINNSHEVVPDGADKIGLRDAVFARTYWIVLLAQVGGNFVSSGFYAHSIGIMSEHGVLREHAITGLSLLSFGGMIAQLLTGFLLDRFNTPRVILPFTIVSFLSMGTLFLVHGELSALSLVFLFGVSCGGQTSMTSYFTTRYFGVRNFATIYGSMMPLMLLATAPAAVVFGACFDHAGSYSAAILLALAALFTSIVFFAMLEPYPYPRKLAIANRASEEQLEGRALEAVAG